MHNITVIFVYTIIAMFLVSLLLDLLLGEIVAQHFESRRREDYHEEFGVKAGRLDERGCDPYTSMMREKDPGWISKFPDLNRWYMFDNTKVDGGKLDNKYGSDGNSLRCKWKSIMQ